MPRDARSPSLLTELLDATEDAQPAIGCGDAEFSYTELRSRIAGAAAALCDRGLRPGERVLVVLPNGEAFATAVFAVWRAGGVVVPLDPRSPPQQIRRIARDCRAAAIVCDGSTFSRVEERLREIPSLRFAVVERPAPRTYPQSLPAITYEDAVRCDAPAPDCAAHPRELALLAYTSGTTGRPKGVMHSHESLVASLRFTCEFLAVRPTDRVLVAFPMYHLFAFRVLLSHLMVGATVIAASDILAGLRRVRETRPNALILVPAACSLLAERFAPALVACAPALRRVCIGSAAISPAALGRLRELLPEARIHLPYGMTEARVGFVEPVEGRAERRLCAVDPNLELRVLDESGNPVHEGIGEAVLRGPALMLGYWHNRASENAQIREEGFHTRDLIEVTAAGERFLVGRLDDVINVGGEKVFPAEVEAALLVHPQIRDAHAYRAPDPRGVRGEVVKAEVVLSEGEFDREEILSHCRSHLEPYKLPAVIESVAEIARDGMSKVTRIGSA